MLIILYCRISDDRGYLSIFSGMWAGYELSVTRALGHKNLEAYGVLCEPAVTTLQLQPNDACLVTTLALLYLALLSSDEPASDTVNMEPGHQFCKLLLFCVPPLLWVQTEFRLAVDAQAA